MKALLIIDMLEDFFEDGRLREHRRQLTRNINQLIAWARLNNLPVFWVRQEFSHDLSDAFLVMKRRQINITIEGTPGSQILGELERDPQDHEVIKKRYSAFFGTSLHDRLARMGVSELILAGVNTHACIRTAAIDAYQYDLDVTIVRQCVDSNDEHHHDVTLQYLAKEIANVVDLSTVVSVAS